MTPLLGTTGCCTMARLFCGPDTSPWVPQSFESARAALDTFREAARRDDATVVYRCLSTDYKERLKQRHGLAGTVEAAVAWERMKSEAPLHMLGYAEVGMPDRSQAGGERYLLDVAGTRVRVDLVRQAYWSVSFTGVGGVPREYSRFVPSLNGYARVEEAGEEQSRIDLDPLRFHHEGVDAVPLDRLVRAEIGYEWKVDEIEVLR